VPPPPRTSLVRPDFLSSCFPAARSTTSFARTAGVEAVDDAIDSVQAGKGARGSVRVLRDETSIDVAVNGRHARVWTAFVGVNRNDPGVVAPLQRRPAAVTRARRRGVDRRPSADTPGGGYLTDIRIVSRGLDLYRPARTTWRRCDAVRRQ